MEKCNNKETSEEVYKRYKEDLIYIKNEIMAQQVNGSYCKWSRPLKAVSVIDISYKQYINYWRSLYKNYPEYIDGITKACMDKLDNGLISRQELAQMIADSNDFVSEKEKAIEVLGGIYIDE